MPTLPDTCCSLLVRLRTPGDSAAWAEFAARYGPAVYGFGRRRGLQEADAVDLSQEVFRKLIGGLGRLDYDPARGRFRSWLFTVVSRELAKFQAKQRRQPAASAELDDLPAQPNDEAAWEDAVRRRLFEEGLAAVRNAVSEQTYRAFTLTAVDGLDGDAAATQLGVSRAAVYLARARVLARLRAYVADVERAEADV